MSSMQIWLSRIAELFRRERRESDMDAELQFHIDAHAEELTRTGLPRAEALRQARLALGGLDRAKEECREAIGIAFIESVVQDVRFALRMFRKSPGFTAIAVLTLALGIGANTALFSVVNGVLLRPLPYPHPEQLVVFSETGEDFKSASISYPNFLDWQRMNSTFSSVVAYRSDDFTLTGSGQAERVRVAMVSAGFFEMLGVTPVRGRLFEPQEDRLGTTPVAMISAGLWRRKFGLSPDIVGKTVTMNGAGYTIVGIVPSSFYFQAPIYGPSKDVYLAIGQFKSQFFYQRGVRNGARAIGRLKPGITSAAAQADMDQVARNLALMYPDADKGAGISIVPLKEDIVGDVQPFLLILLAAVGFVLLIACVNIANLQLARSAARAREFVIRTTLGAGQSRSIRQLLTESILLGLFGGGLGLCLGAWGTQGALKAMPETLPRAQNVGIDARVLIFTLAVSILSAVLFGLAPALKTLRPNLHQTLKESGRGAIGIRSRAQGVFVVIETAVALVLLIGAGLMTRSLIDLWSVNPGFNPSGVLTFEVSLSPSLGVNAATSRAAIRNMGEKLQAIPGVKAVASLGGALPLKGESSLKFWLDGHPKPANESDMDTVLFYFADPGYLSAMGIPLRRGRFFTANDNERAPTVAVIDERFAHEYFSNEDPIGKRIHFGILNLDAEIIGVVGHVKQTGLDTDGDAQHPIVAQAYVPVMQIPDSLWGGPPQALVVLRAQGSPEALVPAVHHAIEELNAENLVYDLEPLENIVQDTLAARRFTMMLLSIFAALALLLSSIGIYGVISYVVGQRTHEIGIRMAIGAQKGGVLRLMISDGMKMALIGVAIGLVTAFALVRLMAKMLYGVTPTDPLTFIAVAVVLSGVALLASYLPARRATRVDPMTALRYE